jgi:flagellar hook assembly protein FlgD
MIYDITGKLVWQKHLDVYAVIPGVNYVQWDGMNDYGMQAANSTYIFRVISGGKVVTKKIVIVR